MPMGIVKHETISDMLVNHNWVDYDVKYYK